MLHSQFENKKILALIGNPIERVDPFRFYINETIEKKHAAWAVEELKKQGANVTVVEAGKESAASFIKRVSGLTESFDVILQFASAASIAPAESSSMKIQKTGENRHQLFEVVGNIDIDRKLKELFPNTDIIGYEQYQQLVSDSFLEVKKAGLSKEVSGDVQVVVTTGKTEEQLTQNGDVLTNGFTGMQGQEIAKAFAKQGKKVALISGKTELPDLTDPNIQTIHVTTAKQMFEVAESMLASCVLEIFVGVAAVADFSLDEPADIHLEEGGVYRFDLQETKSIIGYAASHKNRPKIVVSFAAQSPDMIEEYAAKKFKKLGVDLTVANPIGPNTAMAKDVSRNCVMFISHNGTEYLEEMSKEEVASKLVKKLI